MKLGMRATGYNYACMILLKFLLVRWCMIRGVGATQAGQCFCVACMIPGVRVLVFHAAYGPQVRLCVIQGVRALAFALAPGVGPKGRSLGSTHQINDRGPCSWCCCPEPRLIFAQATR